MSGKSSLATDVRVRPAEAADEAQLQRLYAEFHAFHVRGVPDRLLIPSEAPDPEVFAAAVREIIENEGSTILVAQRNDQVIGLAEVYVRQDEPTQYRPGRRHGHLQSLAIAESGRRHGVGTLLLEAAEAWAAEWGATELQTDLWEFDAGPLEFYTKAGYATIRRTLVKPIGSDH